MSLAFLSPSSSASDLLASPLARALEGVGAAAGAESNGKPIHVRDLSLDAKVELRGDIDRVRPEAGEELVRFSPGRALLLVEGDPVEAIARLRAAGVRAYDASGALAGLAFEGERVARRLTDLDLERLPAAGMFAKIGAVLVRDEGERFRVYVPQELGHYVAECVLDTIAGLDNV